MMSDLTHKIIKSSVDLCTWVEANDYKGYEPFEGNSSYLNAFAFGNVYAQRILQQFVLKFPYNIRPLLGIKKKDSTKGRGYMVKGYLRMLKILGDERYKELAASNLAWLKVNNAKSFDDYSWGNHFHFVSRGGTLPIGRPIMPWTAIIGQSYLDAYELLGVSDYLDVAKSICNWILTVPREKTEAGTCLSFGPMRIISFHHSNMLGAAMLSRAYKATGNTEYYDVAKEAMEYSCRRQEKNGSWYYGPAETHHWIDNYTTGYNLESLKCYIDNTGDLSYQENLKDGLAFYKQNLFSNGTIPKYYHDCLYPVDSQSVGQAIETFSALSDFDSESMDYGKRIASWAIENMQDKSGYFYFRILKHMKVKIPMMHWAQCTIFSGLTRLLEKMVRAEDA